MKNLVQEFQNISHRYELWKKGDKIVVACSGGPDSTCLLDIFAKLQKKYDLELKVAHVNYGLRGKDSDKDTEFVSKLEKKYKVKTFYLSPALSLKKERGRMKMPSENALRKIRYQFFEKVRQENKLDYIAVGHTLDDQAETYLMRIIRGAGLQGLSAMKHKNNFVIRPLLGITKKEILDYLSQNKLPYRTDKTNKEIPYLRNKIRNELIPLIEKKYNSNIRETLYKSSLSVAEDCDWLDKISREIYVKNETLSVRKIAKFHPALQRRMILQAIEEKTGNLKDIESANVEEVLKAAKSTKGKNQEVKFQGLKFKRKGDRILLSLNR
jgi:tRNA(Ile)-lysidine synthase